MQCVIFIGIQATGKSTFYRTRFFQTHAHINLDKLKTRHRESVFLTACFSTQMPFVVDNTNPTIEDRKRYIEPAIQNNYKIIGYYFQSQISDASSRNTNRDNSVPEVALRSTHSKLQLPDYTEGFDELWYVEIDRDDFIVRVWQDEV